MGPCSKVANIYNNYIMKKCVYIINLYFGNPVRFANTNEYSDQLKI